MQNKSNFTLAQLLEFSEHIHSSKTVWLHKMSKAVTINIYLQSLLAEKLIIAFQTQRLVTHLIIYNTKYVMI